jgi:hypothetical protein
MIVEIGTEAVQFLFREYINSIFGTECTPESRSCTIYTFVPVTALYTTRRGDIYPHLTLDTAFTHGILSLHTVSHMSSHQTQLQYLPPPPPRIFNLLLVPFLHNL